MTIPALNLEQRDLSVRPQDDLFRYMNGTWYDQVEIPADRASWGSFEVLRERSEEAVRDIITSVEADDNPYSEASLIAKLYHSFMDEDTVNAKGVAVLDHLLARIDKITSIDELMTYLGWATRHGMGELFGMEVEVDAGDPTRYAFHVYQSGLGLPDESYYREDSFAEIRKAYVAHIETMFTLHGIDDAASRANAVMELETAIAGCHWDKVKVRDLDQMYFPQSFADFCAAAPQINFEAMFTAAHLTEDHYGRIINCQRSFPADVARLLIDIRLEDWKNWARWSMINEAAPFLTDAVSKANFDFYSKTLNGVPVQRPRWKRGVELVQGVLGEAIGKQYVDRHFSQTAKTRMDELVANLIKAYHESISALDWMSDDTKKEALHKLSKFTPKIGYPAKWRDYSSLKLRADDLLGNVIRSSRFEFDYRIGKLAGPVDLDEWEMYPQTVNAYYHPLRNEIVFPAAILQPPFFNEYADDAVNYGGIGAVIGHEIGHGFDDQGSTCDGDGRLRNWWTDADQAAFKERTQALIDQYGALSPMEYPELKVNGEMTIGENIGDLGGLTIAYKAWRLSLPRDEEGNVIEPEPIDGLTAAQRFFLSWSQVWNGKDRPENVRERIATDPHSPREIRANQTVRNSDAFHEAFQTKPGDGEWLDPEHRVSIW